MDIYFDNNYGKLYEEIEGGTAEIFHFECEYGEVKHQFIRREIPIELSDKKTRYDLITPYGYGGPLVVRSVEGKRSVLCQEFGNSFEKYCKEHNIVSEFIRFHPIINNAVDFCHIYDTEIIRETLGTNLRDYEDPVREEFTKSCRSSIRQAINRGIKSRIKLSPNSLAGFIEIYYSTMNRNKATEFYYFPDKYFDELLAHFRNNVLYVEAIIKTEVIAAGLYFLSDRLIHEHLSGTHSEFMHLSPSYILQYAVTQWGKENDYHIVHYGGGTSNSTEDTLYLFKKKFAKNTRFMFSIGKRIWDEDAYMKLCERCNPPKKGEFFPLYRSKI